MQTSAVAGPRADLSTLSLDAALQLDRVERHQNADLSVLKQFVECLASADGQPHGGSPLNLQANPLNVDIFNSAIHHAEAASVEHVSDLEVKLAGLVAKMRSVSEGNHLEAVGALKRFCLSLHQALLSEASPFGQRDEWVLMRDERLA